MASIEYGIDEFGKKIYANDAYSNRTYICPYCLEQISVRKCSSMDDYFAHKSISNRTPQQRICPGYTGTGATEKIEDRIDEIYITNGGLPLYLCEYSIGKYQLDAYFPPISQTNIELLDKWDTKIEIKENGRREVYSASSIRYYRLKTKAEWIDIKYKNTERIIPEVEKKWCWGIRGLNCENDIFHSNFGGGCRVALHSNIVVGKEYLIVSDMGRILEVEGITYTEKGTLKLQNYFGDKAYSVYSMVVNEITDLSISNIQKKGYQLIKKSDEIIPVWPPAVIEGKELIYKENDKQAYLYHNRRSNQKIYNIDGHKLNCIEEFDDVFVAETNNKTIFLSDYQFSSLSYEIKFMLTQTRENFKNKNMVLPNIIWKNKDGIPINLINNEQKLFEQRNICFEANVNMLICVRNNKFVEFSTRRVLSEIKSNRSIVISVEPFGKVFIESEYKTEKKIIELENILLEMYRCNTTMVPLVQDFQFVFTYAQEYSKDLYRILVPWKINRSMPYIAAKYLYEIREVLEDGKNRSGNIK